MEITNSKKSSVLIQLLKGPVYSESQPKVWSHLLEQEAIIGDYMAEIGLSLYIDQEHSFAFLKQMDLEEHNKTSEIKISRLIQNRSLSYPVSLLCALLRKRLAEHDSFSGDPRLILEEGQIFDMMTVYLSETGNEAKLQRELSTYIQKAVDLGVLRRFPKEPEKLEVMRTLTALFDATLMAQLDERLKEYEEHARNTN